MSAKTSKLTVPVADDGKQPKQALPLAMKVPNAETRAAMEESRAMMAARRARFATADALFDHLEKNSSK